MIFDKWKGIFIHIPKTGGGSIESALLANFFNIKKWSELDSKQIQDFRKENYGRPPHWIQHFTPSERRKYLPKEKLDNYFKFAFVRNPWDRILSEYLYIKKEKGCNCNPQDKNISDFDSYLRSGLHCSFDNHTLPQVDFIFSKEGCKQVDFIGRFETISTDFNFICNELGIKNPNLPHFNMGTELLKTGRKTHYSLHYTKEQSDIVAKKYAKDIETFGYKFGD